MNHHSKQEADPHEVKAPNGRRQKPQVPAHPQAATQLPLPIARGPGARSSGIVLGYRQELALST